MVSAPVADSAYTTFNCLSTFFISVIHTCIDLPAEFGIAIIYISYRIYTIYYTIYYIID